MSPISKFPFQGGLETMLEIGIMVLTIVSCAGVINHSLRVSSQSTRLVMIKTYTAIDQQNKIEDAARANLQAQLDLIKKGQELELDRLAVEADMIKALQRKYGK
jgi:hypothetical protein